MVNEEPQQRAWRAAPALGLHGLGAAGAWWVLPHGFPVVDPRFWSNTLGTAALVALSLVGAWGALRGRRTLARRALGLWLGVWAGLAMASPLLYPSTGWPAAALASLPALLLLLALRRVRPPRRSLWAGLGAWLLLGASLGAALAASRAAPPASTHPAGAPLHAAPSGRGPAPRLPGARFVEPEGKLHVGLAPGYQLQLDPLLRFYARSPDGFWSALHPYGTLPLPLVGLAPTPAGLLARWGGPHPASLALRRAPRGWDLDARRELRARIDSHLNGFAQAVLLGPPGRWFVDLGVGEPFEVLPSDYPVGRPARLVVLRPGGELEALEATSGEKGPFRRLTGGPLAGPLRLSLYHQRDGVRREVARLELLDWAAQASRARSPTAGWGLPQNAVELVRDASGHQVWVFVTLAATSVGRGYETVGHAAGLYRSRIRVRIP